MDSFTDHLIAEATEYEFKSALETKKAKSWLKTVSAFSNGLGGTIYFGINSDGSLEGLSDLQNASEKISELILAKIEPAAYFILTPVKADDGRAILKLEVKAGTLAPYYYVSDGNRIPYVRMGEESVQAPPNILSELILKGQRMSFDAMITEYNKSDFSFSIFEATYRQRMHKALEPGDYISFGLADRSGKLTNAGLLFSDQCPLLQSRIFCTRWDGLEAGSLFKDALDDKEYEGNILSLLENTKLFVKNNSKKRWSKTADGRIEWPDYEEAAIHEALVNALVHRSYISLGSEIHVDMFNDRLVICSPGGMINGKKIQNLELTELPSERRNPVIADVLSRMHLMERRGSGIKEILRLYSDKKPPEFYSTDIQFTIKFWNQNHQECSDIKTWNNSMDVHETISEYSAPELFRREKMKEKIRKSEMHPSQKALLIWVLDTVDLQEKLTDALLCEMTGCDQQEAVKLIHQLEELDMLVQAEARGVYLLKQG